VDLREGVLVATRGTESRPVPLDTISIGLAADTYRIFDVQSRVDTAYVLLSAYGASRPGTTSGPCSAGDEEGLAWLAIGPDLHVARAQSVLRTSCLENREVDDSPPVDSMTSDTLVSAIEDARLGRLRVRYDRRSPGRGLVVDTIGFVAGAVGAGVPKHDQAHPLAAIAPSPATAAGGAGLTPLHLHRRRQRARLPTHITVRRAHVA
jgi:hypothetical protein